MAFFLDNLQAIEDLANYFNAKYNFEIKTKQPIIKLKPESIAYFNRIIRTTYSCDLLIDQAFKRIFQKYNYHVYEIQRIGPNKLFSILIFEINS